MAKLPEGEELEKLARDLGVDIQGEPRTHSSVGSRPRASDYVIQQRVIEAKRASREVKLWVLAVFSFIMSAVSIVIGLLRH
jgi:hypothetical protein